MSSSDVSVYVTPGSLTSEFCIVSKNSSVQKSRTPKLRKGHASGDLQSPGVELLEVTKIRRQNVEIPAATHLNA
jgi:hypothetical protein